MEKYSTNYKKILNVLKKNNWKIKSKSSDTNINYGRIQATKRNFMISIIVSSYIEVKFQYGFDEIFSPILTKFKPTQDIDYVCKKIAQVGKWVLGYEDIIKLKSKLEKKQKNMMNNLLKRKPKIEEEDYIRI
jgi:hypothetical protein